MIDVSPELAAFIREEYDRCLDEELSDEREVALDRYNGKPYGNEEDGSSQVVARDTAEAVDYMVISILRTLISGDDVVEFVHRNAELAHQVTQTIKHLFMDEQDGYQILHDWLKAGLLEKNAVAMTYGEPRPPKRKTLEGVSAMALMAAEQQGIKVVEAEETGEEGEEGPIFNVTIVEERGPKFCDAAVPNEEFYCSPDARTIAEAQIKGRKVRKMISELIQMGFDRDDVEALNDDPTADTLSEARSEDRYTDMGARRGNSRFIWWHEEYVRFDANGDGIAELLYVQRTSDHKIFAIEEMEDEDDHPFEDWCPFPMPHRRIGQSLADKTMDIEAINTALMRQSLDGIYLANNPSTYVHEGSIGENTIEDLLTVKAGRLVRWKGAVEPKERSGNFDPSAGFNMLEFMRGELESRTGITRLNQGLDADALNKTATGTALMQAQGQQVEEYLARNFANALARLFTKKAKLLKRYAKPITVPIDGEFVEVNPTEWPEDLIARPRVGLGSGRKDQRIEYRRELMEYQARALEIGLSIVDAQTFFNSAKGFVNDVGLGDVTEFFLDPSEVEKDENGQPVVDPETGQPKLKNPPAEPQPDPMMAKVEAQMQAEQMKLQMKQQELGAKMQLQQAEAQAKLEVLRQEGATKAQIDAHKMQMDAQLEQARAAAEAQIAQQRLEVEAMLKVRQLELQEQIAARDAGRRDVEANAKMAKMRSGGSLAK